MKVKSRRNSSRPAARKMIKERWQEEKRYCPQCTKRIWFPRFETAKEFLSQLSPKDRGYLAEWIFLILRQVSAEHVVPLGLGGTHTDDNLDIICTHCNGRNAGSPHFGVATWANHE